MNVCAFSMSVCSVNARQPTVHRVDLANCQRGSSCSASQVWKSGCPHPATSVTTWTKGGFRWGVISRRRDQTAHRFENLGAEKGARKKGRTIVSSTSSLCAHPAQITLTVSSTNTWFTSATCYCFLPWWNPLQVFPEEPFTQKWRTEGWGSLPFEMLVTSK